MKNILKCKSGTTDAVNTTHDNDEEKLNFLDLVNEKIFDLRSIEYLKNIEINKNFKKKFLREFRSQFIKDIFKII